MPSPYAVCREILHIGKERNIGDISLLKLIKLAYISHGICLAVLDKPLFEDQVEAWRYGPVIVRIYDAVRHYKSQPISTGIFDHVEEEVVGDDLEAIKCAMDIYGKLSALQLSTITHRKGTPWHQVKKRWFPGSVVPNELIKNHYIEILSVP